MNGTLGDFKDSPLRTILLNLLNTVNEDGSWISIEHNHWNPIISTLTVELLLSCDLYPKSFWFIKKDKDFIKIDLEKSLKWLDTNMRNNDK